MKDKLSILLFIETGGPGGAEQVAIQLLEGLREKGHEVFLATLRTGWLTETATKRGFPYYQVHSQHGLDPLLPVKIARLCSELNIDVLHSHLLDSNFYCSIAAKILRLQGRRVAYVGTEHGDVHHINPKKLLRLKLNVASSGRSIITSVSGFSAGRLRELGVRSEKVVVVPNPLRQQKEYDREAIRQGLVPPEAWAWVHVGNLRPVKDQQTLIRGFAHARTLSTHPQRLLIVGDGEGKSALLSLAQELRVQDDVCLLGHSDEVERYLSAGDGFLMTSLSESMPMALLEAVSYGLYPICSRVGGIPEVLAEAQLFEAKDWKKLGELCAHVVAHPDEHRTRAAKLREELKRTRTLGVVCDRYIELYQKQF